MTLEKIIAMVDEQEPNDYTTEQKLRWISELEARVLNDIINPRKNTPVEFPTYTEANDTECLVEFPYDEMYRWYVICQICLANAEYGKYNNALVYFKDIWGDYYQHYAAHHNEKVSNWRY